LKDQLPLIPIEKYHYRNRFGRNTAPCIALAATIIAQRTEPDAIITVLPSDHIISNVREFHQTIEIMGNCASDTPAIVVLGMEAQRAENTLWLYAMD
jgi:mannose-1-phosphate guanylyltransferase